MVRLRSGPHASAGITLTELMISLLLVSVVFLAATTLQTSSVKFLRSRQTMDVATRPEIGVEQMVKMIQVANLVLVDEANREIDLRVDYDLCSSTRVVPTATTADDNWWHYRFVAGGLYTLCDGVQGTNLDGAGETLVIPNLDTATAVPAWPPGTGSGGSGFRAGNPSANGVPTLVYIHVNSLANPTQEINTEARVGGMTKR